MKAERFLTYLNNPTTLNAESLKELEDLLRTFPFCQSAQLLYTFNLFLEKHTGYEAQLKKAAVFASDRKRLKKLILREEEPAPVTREKEEAAVQPTFSLKEAKVEEKVAPPESPAEIQETPPPKPDRRIGFTPVSLPEASPTQDDKVRDRLLEIVHHRLAEIAGEKQKIQFKPSVPKRDTEEDRVRHITFSVEPEKALSKEELIEKFIREEPKISSPRTTTLRPNLVTEENHRENDEIVSETLAILYHKQGNTPKAIRVYEKLRLLFPEKSGYFAARIEVLKSIKEPDDQ